MDGNGWEWPGMDGNGWEWMRMDGNGRECPNELFPPWFTMERFYYSLIEKILSDKGAYAYINQVQYPAAASFSFLSPLNQQ